MIIHKEIEEEINNKIQILLITEKFKENQEITEKLEIEKI